MKCYVLMETYLMKTYLIKTFLMKIYLIKMYLTETYLEKMYLIKILLKGNVFNVTKWKVTSQQKLFFFCKKYSLFMNASHILKEICGWGYF